MEVGTKDQVAEVLSLQSRIEQCEAAIETAHGFINGIGQTSDEARNDPEAGGAMAAIDRCNTRMSSLNEKLSGIAERVGHL